MFEQKIETVGDLIKALEDFQAHHGNDAPVHLLSLEDALETVPVSKAVEISDDAHDMWDLVAGPTLLLY